MRKIVIVLIIFIICGIGMMVLVMPNSIALKYDEVIYEPDVFDTEKLEVKVSSLSGYDRYDVQTKIEEKENEVYVESTLDWYGLKHLEVNLHIPIIHVVSVEATAPDIHEGEKLKNVTVTGIYEDGKRLPIKEYELDGHTVKTAYGDAEVQVNVIPVDRIEATYEKDILVGYPPEKEGFLVKKVFHDGYTELIHDFDFDADVIEEDSVVRVTYGNYTVPVEIVPVKIVSATPLGRTNHKSGKKPGITGVVIVYENGYSRELGLDEVEFLDDIDEKMLPGENVYHFQYLGGTYSILVHANTTTFVEDAVKYFKKEVANADYKYISDSIFVTITSHKTANSFYYLSHIVINDPSQIRSGLSHDTYGGEREKPTDAAKRLGWVIGTNGSNFSYETGRPVYAGTCIKNRQVMEPGTTNGLEICLMSNGVLFSPEMFVDPYKLIASGVTDTWSCGDTLLVIDGENVNVGDANEDYRYPRTAIGMVQPCEYYLITAGTTGYAMGLTYREIRDILLEHDCTFGKCMDGGGSSSLVFQGKLINTPVTTERPVVDFLYFVE